MKYLITLLILTLLISSCTTHYPKRIYTVSVVDFETNLPIDSAKIELVALVDALYDYKQEKYTNQNGLTRFKTQYPKKSQITFSATKDGYQKIGVNHPDGKNLGYYYLENNKQNEITLYLTKKSFDEIFNIPVYNIDSIVEQLLANNCSFSFFNLDSLKWNDIPELLEIANNTKIINKYPVHPYSSTLSSDCFVGIVALWYIEYIRFSEQVPKSTGLRRFPYQTPQLAYLTSKSSVINTKEQMLIAYSHYQNWWNKFGDLPSEESSKTDPLKDSNVKWKSSLNLPE